MTLSCKLIDLCMDQHVGSASRSWVALFWREPVTNELSMSRYGAGGWFSNAFKLVGTRTELVNDICKLNLSFISFACICPEVCWGPETAPGFPLCRNNSSTRGTHV